MQQQARVEQIANKVEKKIPKRPLGYMGSGIPAQDEEKVMMNDHETLHVSRYPMGKKSKHRSVYDMPKSLASSRRRLSV